MAQLTYYEPREHGNMVTMANELREKDPFPGVGGRQAPGRKVQVRVWGITSQVASPG